MTDLAQGYSAKVVLRAGAVLRVSAPGTATVLALQGAPSGSTAVTAKTQDFGPYGVEAVLRVSATSGTVTYGNVAQQPVLQNPADGKLYAGGAEVAVSGGASTAKINAQSSVVVLGDSLMANGNNDGVTATWGGCFTDSHILYANDALAVPLDVITFLAVGGKTVAQVASEQLAPALASSARIAIIHAGANSMNDSIGNLDYPAVAAQMAPIIASLAAAKDLVILQGVQPVNFAGTTGLRRRAYQVPLLNEAYKQIAAQYSNVLYLDTYTPLLDPTSLTLDAKGSTLNATDGIHYLTRGARLVGTELARLINSRVNLTKYRTEGANLLPAFTGNGGTLTAGTGTVTGVNPPAGWEVTVAAGAASVVVSNPTAGVLRLTMTNAGGSASVAYLRLDATRAAALLAALSAGDVVQQSVAFNASNMTNCSRACAVVGSETPAYTWQAGMPNQIASSSDQSPVQPAWLQGTRYTPPRVIPSGLTAFNFVLSFGLGATNGSETVDISLPKLVKLT